MIKLICKIKNQSKNKNGGSLSSGKFPPFFIISIIACFINL